MSLTCPCPGSPHRYVDECPVLMADLDAYADRAYAASELEDYAWDAYWWATALAEAAGCDFEEAMRTGIGVSDRLAIIRAAKR